LKVFIISLGSVDSVVLKNLAEDLEKVLKIDVTILGSITLSEEAYSLEREQYSGDFILKYLSRIILLENGKLLGVTEEDLYAKGLNFIFGIAQISERNAVISLNRLKDKIRERALKEAVHELGHTFGLLHCENKSCVMSFSNNLDEVDAKSSDFCSEHNFLR